MNSKTQKPLNIVIRDELKIIQLGEMVIELTESEIVFEPLPPRDPQIRQPDIAKSNGNLNWSASICLETGLQKSIVSFETQV